MPQDFWYNLKRQVYRAVKSTNQSETSSVQSRDKYKGFQDLDLTKNEPNVDVENQRNGEVSDRLQGISLIGLFSCNIIK